MAKDVDLSSKQWRDIVFEGKNKEYGAYEMRKNSDSRHNKAMLVIVIFIALVFILTLVANTIVKGLERPEDQTEQELVELGTGAEEETKEDEPEQKKIEEPEVIKKEDLVQSQSATDLVIKKDELVTKELTSQDKKKEDDRVMSVMDNKEGMKDFNVDEAKTKKAETVFEEPEPKKEEPKKEEKKEDTNKVFDHVEQMPVFPGGDAALMKYLASHVKYPEAAKERQAKGRVMVRFVVTETGAVSNPTVVKSVDPDLDRAALAAVKSLPKFTPGKQNGHAVKVYYTVPITFKLQE